MTINSHKDLDVWKKSIDFVTSVYSLTESFPQKELYGLTSQMRRAAISIASNIAEGRSKRSTREFMRFINMACGSAAEVDTQLIISEKLKYISLSQLENIQNQSNEIARMLNGMYASLEKKLNASEPQTPNPKPSK